MNKVSSVAFAAIFVSSHLFAQCGTNEKVFSCTTKKGKIIEVCDKKKTIQYSFGKANKPDILINVPREKVTTSQWSGMGPMAYSVTIPNANAQYSVYSSVDRMSEEHTISAGVDVILNGKHATTVECSSNIDSSGLEGIDLKPTE